MSHQNSPYTKSARRVRREIAERTAAKRIPFAGVHTTNKIVLGQRYNAVHGLPFSASIANVRIVAVTGETP